MVAEVGRGWPQQPEPETHQAPPGVAGQAGRRAGAGVAGAAERRSLRPWEVGAAEGEVVQVRWLACPQPLGAAGEVAAAQQQLAEMLATAAAAAGGLALLRVVRAAAAAASPAAAVALVWLAAQHAPEG